MKRESPRPSTPIPRPLPRAHPSEAVPGRDYTSEILEFLRGAHGAIRLDGNGDYFYENVSTLSLHFLLKSRLPGKELLWVWYQYFDGERSESIYQTLPPQRDEEFLDILATCNFSWDLDAVRQSGLVFLPEHRTEVYLAMEEYLSMRLDTYDTLSDGELAEVLTPSGSWSDAHLRKLVRKIQTQPLTQTHRQAIYAQFESDYLKATARHLIDEALNESFWKSPPPELEALHGRFIIFARTMANTARRLGVYSTRRDYEQQAGRRTREQDPFNRRGNGRASQRANNRLQEASHFETLGLAPTASLVDVKYAYREMVKQHHPDQGGSVPDFLRLQEAYEYLLTQVF